MVRIKTNQKTSKKPKLPASRLGRAGRLIAQRARVLVALTVVALLGWGMQSIWRHFAPQISQRNNYLLTDERITITSPPEWIRGDVRSEAVLNAGLSGRFVGA